MTARTLARSVLLLSSAERSSSTTELLAIDAALALLSAFLALRERET
jgi:hypothetical protein